MNHRSLTGHGFVATKYLVKAEGGLLPSGWTARLLILKGRRGTAVILWRLYEYMVANWTKSDAWQVQLSRAVGLFWDYSCARSRTIPPKWSKWKKQREIFRGFASALLNGTIVDGKDPLGLYWHPQSVEFSKRTVSALENFAVWVAIESRNDQGTAVLNRNRSHPERKIIDPIIESKRRGFSLLGYLNKTPTPTPPVFPFPNKTDNFNREGEHMLSFPPAYVETVLWDGFLRPGRYGQSLLDYNVRDMMIYLLQAYGGLREHEPFHIWVGDIAEDPLRPQHASVLLFHPEEGLAYVDDEKGGQRKTTRLIKLREDYLLVPRTRGIGSYRVGWKNSKVITRDKYAVVYWSDRVASALFWQLYVHYVTYRSFLMAQRNALALTAHPFLFVSEREARGAANGIEYFGAPAGIESYDAALRRAVNLVGLRYGKEYGTTSQGLRHLYAYTLRALGVSSKVLQEGLRHRNPFSQDVYGNLTPSDINAQIQNRVDRNRGGLPGELGLARSLKWIEERFPEYRTGAGGLL